MSKIAIKGIAQIGLGGASKAGKLAKRAGKILPLVGFMITYNNARANGECPASAAYIAGLEEANPFPVGYEEFHDAGVMYQDEMDRLNALGKGQAREDQINGETGRRYNNYRKRQAELLDPFHERNRTAP